MAPPSSRRQHESPYPGSPPISGMAFGPLTSLLCLAWLALWVLFAVGVAVSKQVTPSDSEDVLAASLLVFSSALVTAFIPISAAALIRSMIVGRHLMWRKSGVKLSLAWLAGISLGIPAGALVVNAVLPGEVNDSAAVFGTLAQVLATLIVAVFIDVRRSLAFVGYGAEDEGVRRAIQLGVVGLLLLGMVGSLAGLLSSDLPDSEEVRYGLGRAVSLALSEAGILAALVLLAAGPVGRVIQGEVSGPVRRTTKRLG